MVVLLLPDTDHVRVVGLGPGHTDADGHWAADVHLDLDRVTSDGATVAELHLGVRNAERPDEVEAVGIELTLPDLLALASTCTEMAARIVAEKES